MKDYHHEIQNIWIFMVMGFAHNGNFFETWARIEYSSTFLFNKFNLQSILIFASAPLILGLGQTLVIISGGIDLSVGFVMGFGAVILASIIKFILPEYPFYAFILGIILTIIICSIPGLINGILITSLNVPPFIGTLGMYGIARGLAYIFADGMTVPVNNDYLFYVGTGKIYGIPIVVLIAAIFVVIFHFTLSQTKFGQNTYAIGGNKDAAIRAGINYKRHTIFIYIISASCACLAGFIYTSRFSAGAAQAGETMLLDSIAAVFIGGASFYGGSGKILGTLVGALVIAVIQFGLVFVDMDPFWQYLAVGMVIIIAVLIDQSKSHLSSRAS